MSIFPNKNKHEYRLGHVGQCSLATLKIKVWVRFITLKKNYWLIYFTLQYCIGFATHWLESIMGIREFPILDLPPTSLPIPSLWVIQMCQPRAPCFMHQTCTGDSFNIWQFTGFNAILPHYPALALSHRVQKSVQDIWVSFAVSHTGLSLKSF